MKKVTEEIFIRGFGMMFGFSISFTDLILLVFGIAFCSSAIGILVGSPLNITLQIHKDRKLLVHLRYFAEFLKFSQLSLCLGILF